MTKQEQEFIDHCDAIMEASEEVAVSGKVGNLISLNKAMNKRRKLTREFMTWFREQVK